MRTAALVGILIALLFTVPSLAEAWGGKGEKEPDTRLDATLGWMYASPDTTPCANALCSTGGNKVYFNGFLGEVAGYDPNQPTDISLNFATLGTGIPTFPDTPKAMLGIWKDCNNDGYIGFGDNGLFEYRTTILTEEDAVDPTHATLAGTSICPVGAKPLHPGDLVPHNDGDWVHEFIPLGPDLRSPTSNFDANLYNAIDWSARVWVDDGTPGGPPSGSCYTGAYPPGSFHSVGGIVSVLDCYLTDRVDGAGTTVLCVADCSIWTDAKGTQNPWGDEDDSSDATVWDCGSTVVSAPTEANVAITIHAPKIPPSVDTTLSGSLAGTANATGSGLTPTCTPYDDIPPGHTTNPGAAAAHAPYSAEGNINQVDDAKIAPEFQLDFNERSQAVGVGPTLGPGTPDDLGIGGTAFHRGYWSTRTVRALSRNPFVDRTLIAPQKVTVYSYYAYVSPTAIGAYKLSLPKTPYNPLDASHTPTTGKYGQEACGGFTTGVVNQWQCASSLWYPQGTRACRNPFLGGGPDGFGVEVCARVGDAYDMLDVDCYDMSADGLRENGVSYGVLTGTACP